MGLGRSWNGRQDIYSILDSSSIGPRPCHLLNFGQKFRQSSLLHPLMATQNLPLSLPSLFHGGITLQARGSAWKERLGIMPSKKIVPFIAGFCLGASTFGVVVLFWAMPRDAAQYLKREALLQTPLPFGPSPIPAATGHQGRQGSGLCDKKPKSEFTALSSRVYNEATSQVRNTTHRKKYHLNAMQKGTGGLVDSDRMLLGDIYYNSTSVFGKDRTCTHLLYQCRGFH